jgi:hypothetical protein
VSLVLRASGYAAVVEFVPLLGFKRLAVASLGVQTWSEGGCVGVCAVHTGSPGCFGHSSSLSYLGTGWLAWLVGGLGRARGAPLSQSRQPVPKGAGWLAGHFSKRWLA